MSNSKTEKDGNGDDGGDGDEKNSNRYSIPLVVSVSKGNWFLLKFRITAFMDEILTDSLSVADGISAFMDEVKEDPKSSEYQIAKEEPDFS
ncbi:hypothetical protein L1049_008156 [Liquidambar formosana]|uniref:Uncharacterized protein n=1 Tax=Liquidambar formosana TaxID=63359 RepID=A0AAP0S5P4_LIQFO